jgi:broad specificity phosphatase PhoE
VTKFFLIRHADNALVGQTLAGRKPGVHLNEKGRSQAARLAESLASEPIVQLCSSPMERAIQTAEPLAEKLGLKIDVRPAFNELNFGDWTGRTFSELQSDERWRRWNSYRLGIRPPDGEMMIEVQARFVFEIERLRAEFSNHTVAIVSHGDPLKSVLMYYLGVSLDHFQRFEIETASWSIICLDDWNARLLGFNLKAS